MRTAPTVLVAEGSTRTIGIARPRLGLGEWNELLLDVLLPEQGRPGVPVLLSCDDEAIRRAASRRGLDQDTAVDQLAEVVRTVHQVDARHGLEGLRQPLESFKRYPRPRSLPWFFAALCLCVLAASRMGEGDAGSAHAYYPRLRTLLGLPPGHGEVPGIRCVPELLQALGEWLSDDLQGRRGHLLIPSDAGLPYVGACVGQTVFRGSDRRVLSRFFADRRPSLEAGLDPLRLLRCSSHRHHLTKHARDMLDDPKLEDRIRAAVGAVYRIWDGSVPTETGGRTWLARLQLVPPPRPSLLAGCASEAPVPVRLGDRVEVLPPGGKIELPWWVLNRAVHESLTLGDPLAAGGALRIPRLGATVAFQSMEEGLLHVVGPSGGRLWVLTKDLGLQRRFVGRRVPLPDLEVDGWCLLHDLDPPELGLPERHETAETVAALGLEGGLALDARTYLSGEPPSLVVHGLDERATVIVDGAVVGSVGVGDRLPLPGNQGIHEVVVAEGLWRCAYTVVDGGRQRGYGSLDHDLSSPACLRSGARPARSAADRRVCGAVVSGASPRRLPVMRRSSAPVVVIRLDGTCEWYPRPSPPPWLAEVGLDSPRWEVPDDRACWLICPERREARRLDGRPVQALTPAAARHIVGVGREIEVRDRRGAKLPVDEWWALVDRAEQVLG
ncbi:MAG TPA: hypothetical protein VKY90_01590 [Candidatus Dormibacteraeota bacterium]|nr:hypothetical protein [Candidatus Dormibacteraeota bacterium]